MPPISRRAVLSTFSWAGFLPLLAAEKRTREPAPDFWAKTLDGEIFTAESVKGNVTLLQFWTTWCPYCRRDQAAVEKTIERFGDKGLIVLGIDVGEPRKKVLKFLEDSPRSCKIVLTEDTNLAAIFEPDAYPTYVLIDRGGNLAGRQVGAIREEGLRRLVAQAGLMAG